MHFADAHFELFFLAELLTMAQLEFTGLPFKTSDLMANSIRLTEALCKIQAIDEVIASHDLSEVEEMEVEE